MTSPFMDLVTDAAVEITAVFATPFQLLPRIQTADVNAPVVVDPARASVTFMAVLHTPKAKALITNAYDARTDQRPGASANHPLLRIGPDVIASLGLVIVANDLVLDIDRNVRWRVSSARTTTFGTRECVVNVVG